jgi:DNA repair exonuclease SbcCD nuclease subunit
MRIIHCSDIHLGKTLANNRDRYLDYFKAFRFAVNKAIEYNVNCFVIAGDLFHKGNISPSTLADTVNILKILKSNSIPVIAIEGNHDRFHQRKDESWLLYLSRQGYLKLLRSTEDANSGDICFEPYNEDLGWGGWIEISNHKFYGLGYWGKSVAEQLARASKNLPQKTDIGILHAGVWDQNFMDLGKITTKQFRPLANHFRYVALGHGHLKYQVDDEQGSIFACNPGALEVVNREEADKSLTGNICLIDLSGNNVKVESLKIPRRPYLNLKVNVENSSSAQEALKQIRNSLSKQKDNLELVSPPIIMLDITGKVNYDLTDLEYSACEELVYEIFNPLLAQVYNRTSLVRNSGKYDANSMNIDEIFKQVIHDLVEENKNYSNHAWDIVDLIYEIQEQVENQGTGKDSKLIEMIHNERISLENKV